VIKGKTGSRRAADIPASRKSFVLVLSLIYIAQNQLGLDVAAFRAIVKRITGKARRPSGLSVADLDADEKLALVAELVRLGFKHKALHSLAWARVKRGEGLNTKHPKKAARGDDQRTSELAKIHVAKKQLALDDDTYRAIIERISAKYRSAPVRSSAALDQDERHELLAEFGRLGVKPKSPRGWPWVDDDDPQRRLILALWHDLVELGVVAKHDAQLHLRNFIKRQTGVDALKWLGPEDATKAIEGLKAWRDREAAKRGAQDTRRRKRR